MRGFELAYDLYIDIKYFPVSALSPACSLEQPILLQLAQMIVDAVLSQTKPNCQFGSGDLWIQANLFQ
jgi:hypothetical protein